MKFQNEPKWYRVYDYAEIVYKGYKKSGTIKERIIWSKQGKEIASVSLRNKYSYIYWNLKIKDFSIAQILVIAFIVCTSAGFYFKSKSKIRKWLWSIAGAGFLIWLVFYGYLLLA